MSDSGEQAVNKPKGMRALRLSYCFRFGIGVFLIILAFVAIGFYVEMTTRGVPYFLGALLTGIVMVCLGVFNFWYWRNYTRGNATSNQKTLSLRIEIGISVTALILGFFGIITVGLNGVQTPECHSLLGNCSIEAYKSSNNFKLAVALLLMLILSIISNIICSVIHWRTSRSEGIHIFKFKKQQYPKNRHRQAPIQADLSTGFVMNTRHGQPQAFQGAVLSRPGENHSTNQTVLQGSPIVINSCHGQPEPFDGEILNRPGGSSTEYHSTNQAGFQGGPIQADLSTGFVMNTRHGQPQAFQGAVLSRPGENHSTNQTGFQDSPIVLNARHGQPEPFGGAILSRPDDSSAEQHQTTRVVIEERPIVLNYRHGQPEAYEGAVLNRPGNHDNVADQQQPLLHSDNNTRDQIPVSGSTGYVLNTHHGQPRPFAGAVLSTNTQQPTPQQQQNNVPSTALSDSPPSYESCMKDPSKVKYSEERERKFKAHSQQCSDHSPLNPSAPPI